VWTNDKELDLHTKFNKRDNCETGFDRIGGELPG